MVTLSHKRKVLPLNIAKQIRGGGRKVGQSRGRKKDPGVDRTALRNQEKAAIIDALKNKYSLPELLSALHCPRSSYYYQQKRAKKQDKYSNVKEKIKDIFESNHRLL